MQKSWQDAWVLDHTLEPIGSQTTTAVASWVHVAAGKSVSTNIYVNSYHISSNGITYWIACIPGNRQYPCPNITVNHRTIVSVESTTLHVLDDDGVDQSVSILEKVAERKSPTSVP